MMGMVYKDFLVQRKQLGYYIAFFIIYTVLAVMEIMPTAIMYTMTVLIGMMLPMSTFAYDDLARWNKYAAATPAGRRGIVAGKYVFSLLAILAAAAVSALLLTAVVVLKPELGPLDEGLIGLLICVLIAMIIDAVMLPVLVKFGAEKSRVISIIIFVAIFGGILLLGQLAETLEGIVIPAWFILALPGLLALLAIGGYIISYFIARGIFEKKEL